VRRFFCCAQNWGFSLIINDDVGSFASYCFPKLRKNCALLLTYFPFASQVRSKIKLPYMLIAPFFSTSIQVTMVRENVEEESFMIPRFL
jgi:hypothetical protein